MAADQITYTNKDNTGGSPEKLWRDVDANEVKDVVNAHATDIDALTAYGVSLQAQINNLDLASILGVGNVMSTNIDADGNTIENLATPVNANDAATKAYADSLVIGLVDDRGNYNASSNLFPASGGSGTAGAILKGDLWTISVAGTLGGSAVTAGDLVRALVDTPGQTAGNWAVTENNIGYVAENQSNKENTTLDTSTTKYPTNRLVKEYADTKQPSDADLTDIAGLTPSNDDFIQRKSGVWTNRSLGQVITDLDLYATATNPSTNAYAASTYYAPTLFEGLSFKAKLTVTNTGAATMNFNGSGNKALVKAGGAALDAGDIKADTIYLIIYNGTSWQIDAITADSGTWTITWTGFATPPSVYIARYYRIPGTKLCWGHIQVEVANAGSSNSTAMTITLPFNAANTGPQKIPMQGINNSAVVSPPAMLRTQANSNVADCFLTFANGTWTSSGNKGISGCFTFETA